MIVVLLIITAVAMNQGMDTILSTSGSPNNIILLGKGSEESLERSEVDLGAEAAATSIPGIDTKLGVEAISGEITYQAPITIGTGDNTKTEPALLRGVIEKALLVHTSVTTEMIISGRFTAPGTVLESEIWFDRNDLSSLTQRDSLSSIIIRLEDPEPGSQIDTGDAEFFTFQRNDLELSAIPEKEYYDKLSIFYKPIQIMTWVTAALVAAGAVFGGLNLEKPSSPPSFKKVYWQL